MIPTSPKTFATGTSALKQIKLSALAVCVLMVIGIIALMILAAGKDEDIAGIVASALFVTLVSGAVATLAALLQKRAEKAEGAKPETAPRFGPRGSN